MNRVRSCFAARGFAVLVLAFASGCSGDDTNGRQTQAQDDVGGDASAAIGQDADDETDAGSSTGGDDGSTEVDASAGQDAQASAMQPCCVSNRVTTCVCPGAEACDVEFRACGAGVCVAADQSCPQ